MHGSFTSVVPKRILIAYHLWVPHCQHVPPCSRKSQCAKYNSIKALGNQNRHKCNMKTMSVKKYYRHLLKPTRELGYVKIQVFVNKTGQEKIIAMNICFCEEKQDVGLFVYHLENLRNALLLRVRLFGNHTFTWRVKTPPMMYEVRKSVTVVPDF